MENKYFKISSKNELTITLDSKSPTGFSIESAYFNKVLNPGDSIALTGNQTYFIYGLNKVETGPKWKIEGGDFIVAGNIMALLGDHFRTSVGPKAFKSLFKNHKNLISANELELPANQYI